MVNETASSSTNEVSAVSFVAMLVEVEDREQMLRCATAEDWSKHMSRALHQVRGRLGMFCNCVLGSVHRECPDETGEHREWLWDLVWTDAKAKPSFVPPRVIIEHENGHSDEAFLNDFWKIMQGHAALRVAIGYVNGNEAALARRQAAIKVRLGEFAKHQGVFPEIAEDLVLTRQYGVHGWHALVRPRGETEFKPHSLVSPTGFWPVGW